MTRSGKWVKIDEYVNDLKKGKKDIAELKRGLDRSRGNFNDEFLSNPLSVVQLLTKVLRYQALTYNRVVDIRERIAVIEEDLRQRKLAEKAASELMDRVVYGSKSKFWKKGKAKKK